MNIYGPMLFKDYDYQSNISKIPDKIPNNALISKLQYWIKNLYFLIILNSIFRVNYEQISTH